MDFRQDKLDGFEVTGYDGQGELQEHLYFDQTVKPTIVTEFDVSDGSIKDMYRMEATRGGNVRLDN